MCKVPYLLNSGVTLYLLNPRVNVAGVVVVGDVPAPVLGPRVEHHDVVFCPTNEEAPRLDDWTGVCPAEHAACHLPTTYFPFSCSKIGKRVKNIFSVAKKCQSYYVIFKIIAKHIKERKVVRVNHCCRSRSFIRPF